VKKAISIAIILFSIITNGYDQIPTTCFEIESILVDACGNPEGENEMVRFKAGPNPLNTATLTVNWPNNSWLGVCQNAITAANVSQLNASVTACGYLLEPPGGIIPAGAEVILVTSTNFNVAANSFAGLSDTVYIIFQCQGNTSGHFANATGAGIRTLTMDFAGCSDNVSYSCQQLVDIFGNTGTGGPTTDRDGAAVVYDWSGNATYVNYGCTAPYIPLIVDAGIDQMACVGDTLTMNGFVSGNYLSITWSGGNGTWINSGQPNAQYIVAPGDPNTALLLMNVQTCNGTITDTMQIISPPPPGINSHSEIFTICDGASVQLDAGPGGPFIWNTGENIQVISVSTAGTFFVNAINSCGILSDTVFFYVNQANVVAGFTADSISGNSPLLVQFTNQSTGANAYNWLFGTEGNSSVQDPQFSFTHPGDHLVLLTATNGDCEDTASLIIHVNNCESQVFIPNSFTPNLDEINPEFFVVASCSDHSLVTIFDRWGNEVHRWDDITKGWNGLDQSGNPMPEGVYVYLFELEDLNGNLTIYRGQLNLIR
jgi:gliding motility-associated-like protein